MANQEQPRKPFQASGELAEMAEEAVAAFREENPEKFEELVRTFAGKSVDCALLGHGRFNFSVEDGGVRVEPDVVRGGPATVRAAMDSDAFDALTTGELTPLEAFFKGDLIVRSDSETLHEAYTTILELLEIALPSRRQQELLGRFRERFIS